MVEPVLRCDGCGVWADVRTGVLGGIHWCGGAFRLTNEPIPPSYDELASRLAESEALVTELRALMRADGNDVRAANDRLRTKNSTLNIRATKAEGERDALRTRLGESLDEQLTEARDTIKRLNRRAQIAEAGVLAKAEAVGPGNMGRIFTRAYAATLREQLSECEAKLAESEAREAALRAACNCSASRVLHERTCPAARSAPTPTGEPE